MQLQCAAEEMPIHLEEDQAYFGSILKSICETRLKSDTDGWYGYFSLHFTPTFYHSDGFSTQGIILIPNSFPIPRNTSQSAV